MTTNTRNNRNNRNTRNTRKIRKLDGTESRGDITARICDYLQVQNYETRLAIAEYVAATYPGSTFDLKAAVAHCASLCGAAV